MQWSDIPFRPSRTVLRQFGAIGLIVLAGLAAWRASTHGTDVGVIALGVVAALLGVGSLIEPSWLRPVFVAWMVAAFPIGWLVSQTVLAVLYYVVITPIALFMRLGGRDSLRLNRQATAASYWQPKPQIIDLKRYYQQF